MKFELTSYQKAIDSLEAALKVFEGTTFSDGSVEKEMMRDSVIQRFEYTFELSWKTLTRYFQEYELIRVSDYNNRDIMRMGFEKGILKNVEAWFEFNRNRNLTSHTYDGYIAEQIPETIRDFLNEAKFLLEQLSKKTRID